MIQPHNRHMSFSLYISALAVADTTVLLNGKSSEYILQSFQSRLPVWLFTGGRRGPCSHYPWRILPDCTGPFLKTWYLAVQGPPQVPVPPLVKSRDHHWRPVQTCSLQDPFSTNAYIWWLSLTQAGSSIPPNCLFVLQNIYILFPMTKYCVRQ